MPLWGDSGQMPSYSDPPPFSAWEAGGEGPSGSLEAVGGPVSMKGDCFVFRTTKRKGESRDRSKAS